MFLLLFSSLALIAVWVVFFVVSYRAYTTVLPEDTIWDPYQILGVTDQTSKEDVKKIFRKLSRKYHPDKCDEADKPECERKYIDLSKAAKVLTDDDARELWNEFGHPDGKQCFFGFILAFNLGIALPKSLVEAHNSGLVLLFYVLIFGFALPFYVAKWWYSSKNSYKDKILHSSMSKFYKEVKEHMAHSDILDLICKADEFLAVISFDKSDEEELRVLVKDVNEELKPLGEKIETKKTFSSITQAIAYKVSVLLNAHILRIPILEKKLAEQGLVVAEKAAIVSVGILQISQARFWLDTAMHAIEIRQSIIQSCHVKLGPLYQLPFMTQNLVKPFKHRKINNLKEFVELEETPRRALLSSLNDSEYETVIDVARQYPIVQCTKCNYAVANEDLITPSSIVTLTVEIEHITPETAVDNARKGFIVKCDITPTPYDVEEKTFGMKKPSVYEIHCPYFPERKYSSWWILMGDVRSNRLISMSKGAPTSSKLVIKTQFQAPPSMGEWVFTVQIKNDVMVGADMSVDMRLRVDAAGLEEVFDDDISEPDEDTIAGQMAAIRNRKDEDSDSD